MSPRSEEFWTEARERLAVASVAQNSGFAAAAVSAAYYAMLYAARAALSEEDRYAKTHSGVWNLFAETFVATGRFDRNLAAAARRIEKLRLGGDYDAKRMTTAETESAIRDAAAFFAAVEQMLEA